MASVFTRAGPVGPIIPVELEVAPTIETLFEDAARLTPKLRALLPPLAASSFRRSKKNKASKYEVAKPDEEAMLTKSGVFSFRLRGPAAPPEQPAPGAEEAPLASAGRPTTAPRPPARRSRGRRASRATSASPGSSARALANGAALLNSLDTWRPSVRAVEAAVAPVIADLNEKAGGAILAHGQGCLWGGLFTHQDPKERTVANLDFKKRCAERKVRPHSAPGWLAGWPAGRLAE